MDCFKYNNSLIINVIHIDIHFHIIIVIIIIIIIIIINLFNVDNKKMQIMYIVKNSDFYNHAD